MSDALIIVDMQSVFLKQASHLIQDVQELAKSWPSQDMYWLKYRNTPGSLFEKHLFWSDAMVPPATDLIDAPHQDKTFVHFGYSPGDDFIEALKNNRVKKAYVCGVDTDACVLATMIKLWDNDIRPVLLKDFCASSGGKNFHDVALNLMIRQFGMDSIISGKPRI